MPNLMQQCIERQPQAILSVLGHKEQIFNPFLDIFAKADFRDILLIGSGSSFHAANMARPYMETLLQMPVYPATPTRLPYMDGSDASHRIVIGISESGRSTNTLSALEQLKHKGYFIVGITERDDSPIGQMADMPIRLYAGPEPALQKTMSVLASLLTLEILALELAFSKNLTADTVRHAFYTKIREVAHAMPENIACAKRWYRQNLCTLKNSEYILITGQHGRAAIGGEGALKLVETIRRPAFAYDFEEFLHGPTGLFCSKTQMFFLTAPWDEIRRQTRLKRLCESAGCTAYTISLGDTAATQGRDILLKSVQSACFAPYEMLIPLQILSAYLSEEERIDIDREHFPGLYSDLGSKVQGQP